jgi:metallo-beta-lactamase class B
LNLLNPIIASVNLLVVFFFFIASGHAQRPLEPDPPMVCDSCDEWNGRHEPFRVFGNTYYVGVAGLSAVLLTSEAGHILLDGGLPQSAPLIDANIRKLGFNLKDVRLLLTSHEHYDHVGGVASLQRASGAEVAASAAAADALKSGMPTKEDPQYLLGREFAYPPVKNVRVIVEGETLRVGDLSITAVFTPGHTPGGTSWTWRSCEGARCLNMVYADSLNAVSATEYKFSEHKAYTDRFRRSMAAVQTLPCDILLSVHPDNSRMWDKVRQRQATDGAADPFVDTNACRAYADRASQSLDQRLQDEAK